MRVMIKYWALVLLCVIFGLAGCWWDKEGSGGAANRTREIIGPTTLAPGAVGIYQIKDRSDIDHYRWRVEGDGYSGASYVGGPLSGIVEIRASQSGKGFKVSCEIGFDHWEVTPAWDDHTAWRDAEPLEVTIKKPPPPRFRVVLINPNNLSPATLTGSGTITMIDNAGATRWALYFDGDRSQLPERVKVTVRTRDGHISLQNIWLTAAGETRHLFFPRSGGGSVGAGGSVLNTGARPDLRVGEAGETATVVLSAPGVKPAVITVKYQP